MDVKHYRNEAFKVLEDYLEGTISKEDAANWAIDVIKSCNLEEFPKELAHAVHLLFDLHDAEGSWCPSHEELEQCKAVLRG